MTNKKKGLLIGCAPFLGLFAIFVIYAVVAFIFTSIGADTEMVSQNSEPTLATMIYSLIAVIISLLGIVCVLGIPIGIGAGAYYIFGKSDSENKKIK